LIQKDFFDDEHKKKLQGRPASDFHIREENNSFHAGKGACGIVVATGAHMKKRHKSAEV
jgi:hypothetical protein